jgi:hypothetical protein
MLLCVNLLQISSCSQLESDAEKLRKELSFVNTQLEARFRVSFFFFFW